jgi:transcriptional regulator with XRE-family HTH domain
MPKRRPMDFLRKIGNRIRSRRLHRGLTQRHVAKQAEIATATYALYENGQGHPPAATLHRIAMALGTNTSKLLGEHERHEGNQLFDDLAKLYNHPTIGEVTRSMQDMSPQDRQTLQVIAKALAARQLRRPEKAPVMQMAEAAQ